MNSSGTADDARRRPARSGPTSRSSNYHSKVGCKSRDDTSSLANKQTPLELLVDKCKVAPVSLGSPKADTSIIGN